MRHLINTIRSSTFVRHNAIFFVGSLVMGALNYLYYPVLGRMLHTTAFGETQALVSLFLQISIFLSVLGMLTVNIIANHEASKARDSLILELEKFALLISVVLLVLTVIFGATLERFFQFDNYAPFVVLGLAVTVTVPFTFRSAYLRGKKFFGLASIAGIVGAASKLLLSAILVALGFGTTGAMVGIVLAQFIAFLYAAQYARKHGFSESLFKDIFRMPNFRLIFPELKYALLVLVCSLTITGLYSIDIIVVKHYFDAHTAGLYAGIAAVARIIFFLTASITQVLMPSVRIQNTARHNTAILGKSLLMLSVIGGATLLVFWLLPHFLVSHLMGGNYLTFANLLPRLSLVVFLISILNLFVTYHMALRRYSIALVVVMGALASLTLISFNHGSLQAVVNSLLYGSAISLVLLSTWVGAISIKQFKEIRLWRNSSSQ